MYPHRATFAFTHLLQCEVNKSFYFVRRYSDLQTLQIWYSGGSATRTWSCRIIVGFHKSLPYIVDLPIEDYLSCTRQEWNCNVAMDWLAWSNVVDQGLRETREPRSSGGVCFRETFLWHEDVIEIVETNKTDIIASEPLLGDQMTLFLW